MANLTDRSELVITTMSADAEDPEAYLYDLGSTLFIVIDIFLVSLGGVGNLLTLMVSLRKNLRRSPVSIFIAALAVSDIIVLVLDFLNNWLDLQLNIYLMGSVPFCLFHRWFFNVAYTNSAWLVAGVAVERFVVVCFPLSAKIWCTVRRTVGLIIIMPILLGIIYAYNFATWHVSDSGRCAVLPHHALFMDEVNPWLSATLYSYIPLIIIIITSTLISIRLISANKKRAAMTQDSAADNTTKRVTITVLSICAAFACLTIPLTVWYIWVFATKQFLQQSARIVFIEIIILIFGLSNHAVNFFLYVLTSQSFRHELRAMLGCPAESTQGPVKSFSSQKISAASSEQSVNTVCSST